MNKISPANNISDFFFSIHRDQDVVWWIYYQRFIFLNFFISAKGDAIKEPPAAPTDIFSDSQLSWSVIPKRKREGRTDAYVYS